MNGMNGAMFETLLGGIDELAGLMSGLPQGSPAKHAEFAEVYRLWRVRYLHAVAGSLLSAAEARNLARIAVNCEEILATGPSLVGIVNGYLEERKAERGW